MAARLPDCRMFHVPGETHMMVYRHWHTILAYALNPSFADLDEALSLA